MKKHIPFVVAFALFMENLDATIISTAIPNIAINLSTDSISLKVALTSYLLSLAVFIPISGWFADRFGAKKIFIAAVFIFTLGSLFCGLAYNLQTLVLARILQGIGGAFMMPVGRLILLQSFPKSELIKATNYVTIPALIGPILGPVLGGVIVSHASWRWIFIINIPFGIAGIIFALKTLTDRQGIINKLDSLGFVLFGFGLATFAFAIESLSENFLDSTLLTALFLISLSLFFIYFIRMLYTKHSFLDFNLFKIRTFRITVLGSFLSRCSIGGIPFILPIFFQLGLHKSPLYSGLLLLPYALAMLIMKFFIRNNLRKLGFKNSLLLTTSLLGIVTITFNVIDAHTPLLVLIALLFIHGAVISMQLTCMNVLTYVDLPPERTSAGTSIASVIQQLSISFGIALVAVILRYLLGENSNAFEIPIPVFHATFLIMGLMTIVSALTFFFLGKEDGLETSQPRV